MQRGQLVVVGLGIAAAVLLLWVVRGRTPATESPSLIEQAEQREASRRATGTAPAARAARGYVKREGLHLDVPYLNGRRLAELPPDVIADQLGAELVRTDLPEGEEHLEFEKAQVWTYDGRIYRIRKKLAHPMDIPTALGTSGFPLDLGTPIDATMEIRWNRAWNQRRISLIRTSGDPRLYAEIDVWRFMPKELY
ncbi:MAG: hypothetical protein GY898_24350 [Proteobacteria bacterium]|nr:hypothetical protein [Pseudomonadota bacterium]